MVAKHELKEEDGVPCTIYWTARQMIVKVGKGSSRDTFELKDAEWVDVQAGSHDAAARAQARERSKYAGIAAALASPASSAPVSDHVEADAGTRLHGQKARPACVEARAGWRSLPPRLAFCTHHCRTAANFIDSAAGSFRPHGAGCTIE